MSKLLRHAVDLMTGFSTLPLRIASVIGFVFVIFGATTLILVLINYLIRGNEVPGFTFLASMIAIFSGAQLFALGIFGEYLARMHFRSMDRPTYVIAKKSRSPKRIEPPDNPLLSRPGQQTLFSIVEERFDSPALDLSYYLAPWDRPIFPGNTAAISRILIRNEAAAAGASRPFVFGACITEWCWSVADCLRSGWSNAGSSKRRAFASWS